MSGCQILIDSLIQLNVRGKNAKEKISAFFSRAKQSADEVFLTGQKDVDDFFEFERNHMYVPDLEVVP